VGSSKSKSAVCMAEKDDWPAPGLHVEKTKSKRGNLPQKNAQNTKLFTTDPPSSDCGAASFTEETDFKGRKGNEELTEKLGTEKWKQIASEKVTAAEKWEGMLSKKQATSLMAKSWEEAEGAEWRASPRANLSEAEEVGKSWFLGHNSHVFKL
jgi:hypothetical protein